MSKYLLLRRPTNKETFQQLYFIKTYDKRYFPCFFLDENKLLNCYYRNFPNYPFDLLDEKTFKAIYEE